MTTRHRFNALRPNGMHCVCGGHFLAPQHQLRKGGSPSDTKPALVGTADGGPTNPAPSRAPDDTTEAEERFAHGDR